MADKVSTYQISFSGDAGNLPAFLDSLKTSFRSAVADIQNTTSKLNAFASLQSDIQKSISSFTAARAAAADFTDQIAAAKAAGSDVSDALTDGLAAAQKAITASTKSFTTYSTQLAKLQTQLTGAGVDTANLAAEQVRLATALNDASVAAANQASKDLLGFTSINDVQPRIDALNLAFKQLQATGTLSADEIGAAETQLAAKIAEVRAEVTSLGTSLATQSSKDLLNFTSLDDVKPKIAELTQAFEQLKASGTLSATEIGAAERQLIVQIEAVKAEVTDLGATSFASTASAVKTSAASIISSVVGVVLVLDQIKAKFGEAYDAQKQFSDGLAQIGTITNLSGAQLQALGEDARALARDVAVDVNDALTQLYAIIRTGIPAGNAIDVLRQSADAAKISETSLGDATKLSTTLINQFGVSADSAGKVLNVFIQGARSGGPTLTELANSLGALAPAAIATGTPLNVIEAALTVMTKAGVPAEAAISDLNKVLLRLNTDTARKQLQALGVTTGDLVSTLDQLGTKNLSVDQIVNLGLASQKSATGILALVNGSNALTAALNAQADAQTQAAKALALITDTPKERIAALNASWHDFNITLGQTIAQGAGIVPALTAMLNRFNSMDPVLRNLTISQGNFTAAIALAATGAQTTVGAYNATSDAATKAATALQNQVVAVEKQLQAQSNALQTFIANTRQGIAQYVADLATSTAAIQSNSQTAIEQITARTAIEIASLDQSTAAEQATADQTLAIQTAANAAKLAALDKSSTDILAAVAKESAARLANAQAEGKSEVQIQQGVGQQILQDRAAALLKIVGQYQTMLASLLAQNKTFVDQLNAIDATRLTFNQDIQTKLTEIRNEGLSDFDAYIAKTNQINILLGLAEQAFAQGGADGLKLGKTYIDQVVALTGSITKVVDDNGVEVVSSFDASQKKIELLTKAAGLYNAALDQTAVSAKAGQVATQVGIDDTKAKLADLTAQWNDLQKLVSAGLVVKLQFDKEQITDLNTQINAAVNTKDITDQLLVQVKAVKTEIDAIIASIASGSIEGIDTQIAALAGKLGDLAKNAPQLKLDPTAALATIQDLQTKIDAFKNAKANLDIESNAKDVQADIDKLKLPTESTHTVHVVIDGTLPTGSYPDTSGTSGGGGNSGGTEDPGPVPGLARGGLVGPQLVAAARSAQRATPMWRNFAAGGSVFARPTWSKVPGTGNGDTVPAALQAGSFVVRKAASSYYGDEAMRMIAGAQHFRIGGIVQRILGGSSIADRILAGGLPTLPGGGTSDIGGNLGTPPDPALRAAIIQADTTLLPLAQKAALLPQAIGEQNMGEYLSNVVRLIEQAPDATSAHALLDPLIAALDAISSMIEYARQNHLPIVSGVLGAAPGAGQDQFGNKIGAALGGVMPSPRGTDTVPAMLTPGEFVINKGSVDRVGTPFLHAVNSMNIDRDTLANMLAFRAPQSRAPSLVRHFADGGLVGGSGGGTATIDPVKGVGGGTSNTTINIAINATTDKDWDDITKRKIVPAINRIIKKST